MKAIPKFTSSQTLTEANLNIPLYAIEDNLNQLETVVNTEMRNEQRFILRGQPIKLGTVVNRIVTFNGTEWEHADNSALVNDPPSTYPLGLVTDTSNGTITLHGYCSVGPETSHIDYGVPYYLIEDGKVSHIAQERGIYVGMFIGPSSFILNIQLWINAHTHKRIKLDSTKWAALEYLLDEFPRPAESSVMVIDGQFCPEYGTYIVDEEGIKIVDETYFETLLSTADVQAYLETANTEFFYSDPRSVTLPGVMTIGASTSNISVSNSTGDVQIGCHPVFQTSGTGMVSTIQTNTEGIILVGKEPVVKSIVAGPGITVQENPNSTTTVSLNQSIIYEEELDDVFIVGAMSRIWPNTINTYMELSYLRSNSVVYRKVIPSNVSRIEVYADVFAQGTGTGVLTVKAIQPEYISLAALPSTKQLEFTSNQKVETILLSAMNITKRGVFFVSIGRDLDTSFPYNIGIISVWIKLYY